MKNEIMGYEIREDILDDCTPAFDLYQLMNADSEYVESYYNEESALKHARICAKDNKLDGCEVKVYRRTKK